MCKDYPETLDAIDRATQRTPADNKPVNNVNERPQGNSAAAALRRLRKDRPDLHQQVIAGDDQKAYLRGKRYRHEKKSQGAQEGNDNASKNEVSPVNTSSKTRERLAAEYGVSSVTIHNDAKFADAVDAIAEVAPEAKGARTGRIFQLAG